MLIQETQKALNQLVGKDLPAKLVTDGIRGRLTNAALDVLNKKLNSIFNKKKYRKSKEITMIGVRCSDKYTNQFTDWCIFWNHNNHYQTVILPISTTPGLYGLGNIFNPRWIGGKFGVAVMLEGQYPDIYRLVDTWNGWTNAPYLFQAGWVTIGRDGNKDLNIDFQVTERGFFGINFHSWSGWWNNTVNNLSQGCQVSKINVLKLMLPYWRICSKEKSTGLFDYTLLNIKDFN